MDSSSTVYSRATARIVRFLRELNVPVEAQVEAQVAHLPDVDLPDLPLPPRPVRVQEGQHNGQQNGQHNTTGEDQTTPLLIIPRDVGLSHEQVVALLDGMILAAADGSSLTGKTMRQLLRPLDADWEQMEKPAFAEASAPVVAALATWFEAHQVVSGPDDPEKELSPWQRPRQMLSSDLDELVARLAKAPAPAAEPPRIVEKPEPAPALATEPEAAPAPAAALATEPEAAAAAALFTIPEEIPLDSDQVRDLLNAMIQTQAREGKITSKTMRALLNRVAGLEVRGGDPTIAALATWFEAHQVVSGPDNPAQDTAPWRRPRQGLSSDLDDLVARLARDRD